MTSDVGASVVAGAPWRGEPRLLAGLSAASDGARLHAHEAVHGPLPSTWWAGRHPADPLIAELERSGLTGRGGAGFPTARKLATVAAACRTRLSRRPVVVANVMEGEPASNKDRALATGAPHLVLDGAALLAGALHASAVHVCVAREHLEAARSLEAAVAERAAAGADPVPFTVDRVPGGYVVGEESALASWLDQGDSRPAFRPDRPAILRVGGRPALVDNAETLAHVALIARKGAAWFRSAGLPDAAGTTLLTVSGAVTRPGVWEVGLGTPLATVLANAGGSPELSGVLLGGYGGTWVPASHVGVELAPGPLAGVGATLGAGIVVALPPVSCGLAETARIAAWMSRESAGQCGPCTFGLPALADDLAELASGPSPGGALDRLAFRLREVEGRGACRHPDGVVRLVRSALVSFAADVDRHVHHGPCRGARAPSILPFPR